MYLYIIATQKDGLCQKKHNNNLPILLITINSLKLELNFPLWSAEDQKLNKSYIKITLRITKTFDTMGCTHCCHKSAKSEWWLI
jgi:hypothetical protein